MKNGQIWQDIDGNDIQAHGGCIIKHNDVYYWYGEHKGADTAITADGKARVDFVGISCYSSKNLIDWKYEGLVLEAQQDDIDSFIHPSKVVERPKVIYNEKNDTFVLWMHVDREDYTYAGVGVAVSKSPTGPFNIIKVMKPNRHESRDMTIFKDKDGTAYLIHSKDNNATLDIARLNDDYTDVDGMFVSVMIDQYREAPALLYYDNVYYMVTSGCTGWNPNPALFSKCQHIMGKWRLVDNPCRGENSSKTFYGQSAHIFEAEGKFYLLLDHWKPENLKTSGYSILPIEFEGKRKDLVINWQDEWNGIN